MPCGLYRGVLYDAPTKTNIRHNVIYCAIKQTGLKMKILIAVLLLSLSSLVMADMSYGPNPYQKQASHEQESSYEMTEQEKKEKENAKREVKRCQGDGYWDKTEAEREKQRDPNFTCN